MCLNIKQSNCIVSECANVCFDNGMLIVLGFTDY